MKTATQSSTQTPAPSLADSAGRKTTDPGEPDEVIRVETQGSDVGHPIQLELEGIGTLHPLLVAGHVDPRFILSDETCRIGRKHLAEMRRILTSTAERPAA